ncbi:eukaryotic translation initiation factor 3 subunit J [Schizophyllum amplum]|uniref:Eukaryotic translation initiation factor 3 subunit J n=1 Tax=Schizophyllum amplum TaxID=97359 RepID=A0A550CHQ1_9AGAR|nr:eukaryotic translation initiation factor 3 subunit J [Auriculariopsis ampla]
MSEEWDGSDDETPQKAVSPPPKVIPKAKPSKWEGEDEEGSVASDWDESSDEEEKPASAPVAPPKKKGNLKQKLAEKEAAKAARKAAGEDSEGYDSDAVLDPREKARLDKERELNSDLNNAAELFGAAALGGTSSTELDAILSYQPRTKEDFQKLSGMIIETVIKRHQSKPLYSQFVEHLVRELAMPLRDVEVRKAASGLTTLANEKQKEQRDKASGKKKPKAAAKPALGAAKASSKFDTNTYEESLDDFGTNADDFM